MAADCPASASPAACPDFRNSLSRNPEKPTLNSNAQEGLN
jgi:hypothetical protein